MASRQPIDIKLVCPTDGSSLRHAPGALECPSGCRWEVVDSIPRFVGGHYSEAFGLQWRIWSEVQLDSYTGHPISSDRARFALGDALWRRLSSPEELNVLEAGCGAGRFTEVLLNFPSVRVHSIDASTAVEANQKNFPQDERHRIHQADILRLPFAPRQFDLVLCLGTIQHTRSPEETLAKLFEQVRPGGALVFDHIVSHARGLTNPGRVLLRFFAKRMKAEKGVMFTNKLVDLIFPLHRAARNSRLLKIVLSRLSPLHTAYHHPELNEDLQYRWALLNTHDALTDWYKHSRTKGRLGRTLVKLGAERVEVLPGGIGVVGRCRRPAER